MKIGNHAPKQPGSGHRPHEGHAGKGKPDHKPPHEGGQPPDFPEKYKSPFGGGGHGGPQFKGEGKPEGGKPPMEPNGGSPT